MTTLDYDKSHWAQGCTRADCKQEATGFKFVSVPVSLTTEMAPTNGAFSNAIVRYEATGEVWIYSAEGIPVLVKEGA